MDKVTQYGPDNNQTRAASFRAAEDIEVVVRSWNSDNNDRVLTMARELCEATAAIKAMRAEVHRLNIELATAKSNVPPAVPARLMGPACIRFDSNGALWMLNRKTDNEGRPLPSKGFGEFGFRFDGGWDELFRNFNVRVTEHGADVHGPFWIVENIRKEQTPC